MATTRGLINPAVRDMVAPPIPTVQAWAGSYAGQHGPLIDLSQAVPGYAPPARLARSIAELTADPTLASYGDIEGEAALRSAFATYQSENLTAAVQAENVQITAGCNQAFVVAMLTLAAAGDRVLLANPFFFNHQSALEMLGLKPCFVECAASNNFIPQPDDVAHAIDAYGVRVVALVSPNNPTGAIYPAETLSAIQRVCEDKGVWLVLDETYSDFIGIEQTPRHALLSHDGWGDTTVLLYSFSKVYCTPGLRVGAITAGTDLMPELVKVMDNLQICAPRHAQVALAEALPALADWRRENTIEIMQRANAFRAALAGCDGWEIAALGAYFAYVRHPFGREPSMDVAARMAREAGVLCLPGAFFGEGQENYLRIAFANADVAAIARLADRLPLLDSSAA